MSSKKYLRRYTDLTALIYLLRNGKITLLDPETWDDSNDSHYLAVYKKRRNSRPFWRFALRRPAKDTITGACLGEGQAASAFNSSEQSCSVLYTSNGASRRKR